MEHTERGSQPGPHAADRNSMTASSRCHLYVATRTAHARCICQIIHFLSASKAPLWSRKRAAGIRTARRQVGAWLCGRCAHRAVSRLCRKLCREGNMRHRRCSHALHAGRFARGWRITYMDACSVVRRSICAMVALTCITCFHVFLLCMTPRSPSPVLGILPGHVLENILPVFERKIPSLGETAVRGRRRNRRYFAHCLRSTFLSLPPSSGCLCLSIRFYYPKSLDTCPSAEPPLLVATAPIAMGY